MIEQSDTRPAEQARIVYQPRPPGSAWRPPNPMVITDGGCYPDRRKHPLLTQMIDDYLAKGWEITEREPLTIHRGRAGWQLRNWCLISL